MNERTKRTSRTNEPNGLRYFCIIRWSERPDGFVKRVVDRFCSTADVLNDDIKFLQALCVFGYDFDGYEVEEVKPNRQGFSQNDYTNIDEYMDLY